MLLGWGVSNTIGATLFVAMPFVFYLMYTEDKHAWYYFTAVTLMLIAQVFTYARASLLFTLPLFAAMYVLCRGCGNRRCRDYEKHAYRNVAILYKQQVRRPRAF